MRPMCDRAPPSSMDRMLMTGSALTDAERAFTRVLRSRRRAALARVLQRRPAVHGQLPLYDEGAVRPASVRPTSGIREISLQEIRGTLERSRATQFDDCFRPAASARDRWQRVWLAEHRGVPLPPISVIAAGDGYAIRDGHHRVSVARARGALTIDAIIEPTRGDRG
jgi:hypothetical protein